MVFRSHWTCLTFLALTLYEVAGWKLVPEGLPCEGMKCKPTRPYCREGCQCKMGICNCNPGEKDELPDEGDTCLPEPPRCREKCKCGDGRCRCAKGNGTLPVEGELCREEYPHCEEECLCVKKRCYCRDDDPERMNELDLTEDDLSKLCKVADPKGNTKPSDCVYMKWEFCPGADKNAQRPCGWYVQTKCKSKRERRKRLLEMGDFGEDGDLIQKSTTRRYLSYQDEFDSTKDK